MTHAEAKRKCELAAALAGAAVDLGVAVTVLPFSGLYLAGAWWVYTVRALVPVQDWSTPRERRNR